MRGVILLVGRPLCQLAHWANTPIHGYYGGHSAKTTEPASNNYTGLCRDTLPSSVRPIGSSAKDRVNAVSG